VDELRELVASGHLGEVGTVRVHGAWSRDRAYYRRSRWAGRRRLDGHRVADGVATNPLAHGVHAGLVIAGIDRLADIASVTTELRRAHDIEADDTTFLRIDPVTDPGRSRPSVVCALTTTAPYQSPPWVEITGEKGTVRLLYTEDVTRRTDADGSVTETAHPRTDLAENLLDHVRDPAVELLCPLAATAPFSAVLEAIQSAPDPSPIAPAHVTWRGEGEAARPVVDGIEQALLSALEAATPFSRDGVAWADEDAIATWHPSAQHPTEPAYPADTAPPAGAPSAPTTTTGSRAEARDALDEENRS
jgi:predicted dehydrogenase